MKLQLGSILPYRIGLCQPFLIWTRYCTLLIWFLSYQHFLFVLPLSESPKFILFVRVEDHILFSFQSTWLLTCLVGFYFAQQINPSSRILWLSHPGNWYSNNGFAIPYAQCFFNVVLWHFFSTRILYPSSLLSERKQKCAKDYHALQILPILINLF